MLIVYFSNITNNTERFVEKLGFNDTYRIPLKNSEEKPSTIENPYILITPTYGDHDGRGAVPHQVKKFLTHIKN